MRQGPVTDMQRSKTQIETRIVLEHRRKLRHPARRERNRALRGLKTGIHLG